MTRGVGKRWDRLSIKDIAKGEIEHFFDEDHGIGYKTLANREICANGLLCLGGPQGAKKKQDRNARAPGH